MVADILKNTLRSEDIAARIGGDEFGIILPNTEAELADEISRRISEKCHRCFRFNGLKISIGYAVKEDYTNNLERIFIEADKKMYEDKKTIQKFVKVDNCIYLNHHFFYNNVCLI